MTASIAWFDMSERDAAVATRLYAAALRAQLSPEVSVRLTRAAFGKPAAAPAFAARWRREPRGSHIQEAA